MTTPTSKRGRPSKKKVSENAQSTKARIPSSRRPDIDSLRSVAEDLSRNSAKFNIPANNTISYDEDYDHYDEDEHLEEEIEYIPVVKKKKFSENHSGTKSKTDKLLALLYQKIEKLEYTLHEMHQELVWNNTNRVPLQEAPNMMRRRGPNAPLSEMSMAEDNYNPYSRAEIAHQDISLGPPGKVPPKNIMQDVQGRAKVNLGTFRSRAMTSLTPSDFNFGPPLDIYKGE